MNYCEWSRDGAQRVRTYADRGPRNAEMRGVVWPASQGSIPARAWFWRVEQGSWPLGGCAPTEEEAKRACDESALAEAVVAGAIALCAYATRIDAALAQSVRRTWHAVMRDRQYEGDDACEARQHSNYDFDAQLRALVAGLPLPAPRSFPSRSDPDDVALELAAKTAAETARKYRVARDEEDRNLPSVADFFRVQQARAEMQRAAQELFATADDFARAAMRAE